MARRPRHKDWLAFDTRDRGALRALIILGALVAIGYAVVRPAWDWATGRPLRIPYSGKVNVPGLQSTEVTAGGASYDLIIPQPSGLQRLLDALPDLLAGGVALLVLVLLYRLIADIARREPFTRRNVSRLRVIAFTVAVGWSLASAVAAFVTLPILEAADIGDLPIAATWVLPVVPLGIGMVVALIGEAFKIGAGLRDDVDGLV